MPAGDNPHSISEKKAALRESPIQSKSVVNDQQRTSPFPKDNASAIVGIKRPQPNGQLSPTNHHMLGNSGASGHLVYVRRRLETDQNKGGASASTGIVNSVSLKKAVAGRSQSQEPSLKHQNNVPNTQSAPRSAPPAAVTASPALPPAEPIRANQPTLSNQDCSNRFIRLQTFLRNNEQSGQEEYIRMLRSLSPVGRTKHTFELEKRAANLLVEEGKELQKMKVLNVLGKFMPGDPPSFPSQSPSFVQLPFPAQR